MKLWVKGEVSKVFFKVEFVQRPLRITASINIYKSFAWLLLNYKFMVDSFLTLIFYLMKSCVIILSNFLFIILLLNNSFWNKFDRYIRHVAFSSIQGRRTEAFIASTISSSQSLRHWFRASFLLDTENFFVLK